MLELSVRLCKTEVLATPPPTQERGTQPGAQHAPNVAFGNQCNRRFLPAWLLYHLAVTQHGGSLNWVAAGFHPRVSDSVACGGVWVSRVSTGCAGGASSTAL